MAWIINAAFGRSRIRMILFNRGRSVHMRPVDQKLAHNDTDSGELELSVEAIALALEKVGLHVDPATEQGRLRAAELINEALSDPERTDKIIAALEADAPLASDGAGGKVTGKP